jgi:tetraacyldisaccharide 4'-kinase
VSLDARLQRLWYGPAWRSLPLWPLSLLFRFGVAVRAALYRAGILRTVDAGVPVVVVGNVTVGGTGKTPLAAWVAARLAERGLRVGVVLRGYGGSRRGEPAVVRLSDNPASVGDEAVLHARRGAYVVVIGADRVAAARLAAAEGADIVVSDDGLQHLRLQRDYEIAAVDAARGLGNRWLLPAGPLREPVSRLGRVQAVVATCRGPDECAPAVPGVRGPLQLSARFSLGPAVNLITGERRPLDAFRGGGPLHAVAGIGNPEAYFQSLRAAGLHCATHALPDHSALDPAALPFARNATVMMTEKDAVKCQAFAQPDWWWVDLDVSIDRADAQGLLASILDRTGLTRAGVTLG